MKINKQPLFDYIAEEARWGRPAGRLLDALINHFEYSVANINSYDELPDDVKSFISENEFKCLTTWGS